MRSVLVCTVGTSLIGNLMHSEKVELRELAQRRNSIALSHGLLSLDPQHRLLGAEINSVSSILKSGRIDQRDHLYLVVSDTQDGAFIGEVLKHYYESPRNSFGFDHVKIRNVSGLTDSSANRFRTEGLRNLVKEIAKIVWQHGPNTILINATGGYKAQISFAGMIGQAIEIPVCYLFERFSEVIELPPQPISMDLSFWMNNADTFFMLAHRDLSFPVKGSDEVLHGLSGTIHSDERFASLIDEIETDGQQLVGLSPVGQLFHESFRYRFLQTKQPLLPPKSEIPPREKPIKYEDDNPGKHSGLQNYFEKIAETSYVTGIYTFYYNQDLALPNYFRTSPKCGIDGLEGGYSDGKTTTKFSVRITARTAGERDAAKADLCEKCL